MTRARPDENYQFLELNGIRYAVLPEAVLQRILRKAGIALARQEPATLNTEPGGLDAWDPQSVARHLITRRRRAGLTQTDLARRSGIRVETLNRIERGRTNPDFSTIRKLAIAIRKAEARPRR